MKRLKESVKMGWAKGIVKKVVFFCFMISGAPVLFAASGSVQGMVILLDESERSLLGAITGDLVTAISQEACPIIVSGSLLRQLYGDDPYPGDLEAVTERFKQLQKLPSLEKESEAVLLEKEKLLLAFLHINKETFASRWVLKEIDPSLYLLLPEAYLKAHNVMLQEVEFCDPEQPVSALEYKLGLKVNHLKTVFLGTVLASAARSFQGRSFIENMSDIFVTRKEYHAGSAYAVSPVRWGFCLSGHGFQDAVVAGMSLSQFRMFLSFLEEKISTALLYYISCFAAGSTHQLLYKEDQLYSFPLITQALTDAPVQGIPLALRLQEGQLKVAWGLNFTFFCRALATGQWVEYQKFVAGFTSGLKARLEGCLPQIRFPGIPWFVVIDADSVVTIGNVLAKTKQTPLYVFSHTVVNDQKQELPEKHPADIPVPVTVLVYAQEVPFEIVVTPKNGSKQVPAFISMTPGDALHHLTKISSVEYSVTELLASFFKVKKLASTKSFLIDEIKARSTTDFKGDENFCRNLGSLDPKASLTLSSVIIIPTYGKEAVYFLCEEVLYKSAGPVDGFAVHKATAEERRVYASYLRSHAAKKFLKDIGDKELQIKHEIKILEQEKITRRFRDDCSACQLQADAIFEEKLFPTTFLEAVKKIIVTMPDHAALYFPELQAGPCQPYIPDRWTQTYSELSRIFVGAEHKIIFIKKEDLKNCPLDSTQPTRTNIIIECTKMGTQVFCTNSHPRGWGFMSPKISWTVFRNGKEHQTDNYMLKYDPLLNTFFEDKVLGRDDVPQVDESSVYEHLTDRVVLELEKAVERRSWKIKNL